MYPGLPALSYRLVPRAGSPACPGLTALGPKKYIGRAASGTEMYLGLSGLVALRARGWPPLVQKSTQGRPPWAQKCTQGRLPPGHKQVLRLTKITQRRQPQTPTHLTPNQMSNQKLTTPHHMTARQPINTQPKPKIILTPPFYVSLASCPSTCMENKSLCNEVLMSPFQRS